MRSMDDWDIERAETLDVVTGRLGSISLYELADPVAVLAMARGAISLRMIRSEIDLVSDFAQRHQDGWCYLADVRRVRLLNPLNIAALRRITRLPGVRHRIIVAPGAARWLEPIAIGELATSPSDALARCRRSAPL